MHEGARAQVSRGEVARFMFSGQLSHGSRFKGLNSGRVGPGLSKSWVRVVEEVARCIKVGLVRIEWLGSRLG